MTHHKPLQPSRSIGVHVTVFSGGASNLKHGSTIVEPTKLLKGRISNPQSLDASAAFCHRCHGRNCRLWRGPCRSSQTAAAECGYKSIESFGTRRAGANAGGYPIFQVKSDALAGRNFTHAQLVAEPGAATSDIFVARYRLQPTNGLLQESFRRHEHAERSGVKRLENIID